MAEKEVKKVKCKKCRLTYDKKKYECPYCHKKRFNPTGLIVLLILLVIAAGVIFYFFGDKIKDFISDKNAGETIIETINEDNKVGLVFKNLTVEKNAEKENFYTVKFDIENTTSETIQKTYTLKNLVDKVSVEVKESDTYWIYEGTGYVNLELIPEEISKVEYDIIIDSEWKTLEIYLTEENRKEDTIKDLKIFTYENDIVETTVNTTEATTTEATTTDVSIITE